jgi:S1-C subfamily serine protease
VNRSSLTLRLALAASAAALAIASAVTLGIAHGASASTPRTPTTGVVVVTTNLGYQDSAAAATGIVLSSSEVLTNNHVIRGATAVRVTDVSTGRTYSATVAGYDVSADIALLKINVRGLKTAAIGSSSGLKVGQRATAVGNAGGTGTLTVAAGAVTALHQAITVSDDRGGSSRLTDLIETSAPLQPGDSGGPLLDGSGRVIGVDAAGSAGQSRFEQTSGDGYAIPIDTATAIARQIEAGRASSAVHIGPTAFIGVGISGDAYSGATIQGVVQGGPADRAGLAAGDVITSFGGHRITSPTSLQLAIRQATPGKAYRITWIDQYGAAGSATIRPLSGPPQ